MRAHKQAAVCCALAGLMLLVGWSAASPGEDGHPEIDGATTPEACDVCHADVTPEVVAEWSAGKHGANNVKCFVCHGSTGADFVEKPVSSKRCIGCHADHVATMGSAAMKGKMCMSCHPAHLLDPHLDTADGGEE